MRSFVFFPCREILSQVVPDEHVQRFMLHVIEMQRRSIRLEILLCVGTRQILVQLKSASILFVNSHAVFPCSDQLQIIYAHAAASDAPCKHSRVAHGTYAPSNCTNQQTDDEGGGDSGWCV